jgi:hypothetical protein
MTEPKESRTVTRAAEQNRIKEVQAVNATRTLPAVLSIALTVAGLALMLTTHDATVHLLAACLVANELAKEAGRL